MKALKQARDYALFYLGLAIFAVACLTLSVPAGLLHRLLPGRRAAPLGQFMIMGGCRLYLVVMQALGLFRCDLGALDRLRTEGGLVIAPNHPSLVDIVLIVSRLPRVVCITKASLWDNFLLGGIIRLAYYIRNDAPVPLVKQAVRELRAGRQLLIFPEGTRTVGGSVQCFKGGFALMAKAARVPVQTVFLEGNSPFLGKGWRLFRKPEFPLRYRARLGGRFMVGDNTQLFVRELEAYFRDELRRDQR